MKKFIVEFNVLGSSQSYVFTGKDEADVREQALIKNKKLNGFISNIIPAID